MSVRVKPMGVRVLDVKIISSVPIDVHETGTANVSISSSVTLNIRIVSQIGNVQVHEAGTANVSISSSVTLNIDISAQTLPNLNIHETGTANVSITTSITLNINITGQTADLNIDIKAQSVSVKLVPDWGAIQAQDIDILGTATTNDNVWTIIVSYTVPNGKTLLIYDWSLIINAYDGQLIGRIYNETTMIWLSVGGGVRGFQTPFSKPKRVTQNQTVKIYGKQNSGQIRELVAHFGGTLV